MVDGRPHVLCHHGKPDADGKPVAGTSPNAAPVDRLTINVLWMLVTGFLVIAMQAGFAMVETGLTRSKNVTHTMTMNLMVYALGVLGFFALGFALM